MVTRIIYKRMLFVYMMTLTLFPTYTNWLFSLVCNETRLHMSAAWTSGHIMTCGMWPVTHVGFTTWFKFVNRISHKYSHSLPKKRGLHNLHVCMMDGWSWSMSCMSTALYVLVVHYQIILLLSGKDVVILQNLLQRSYNVTSEVFPTGFYDKQTAVAVAEYKKANLILRYAWKVYLTWP